jgi:hypothetical protein
VEFLSEPSVNKVIYNFLGVVWGWLKEEIVNNRASKAIGMRYAIGFAISYKKLNLFIYLICRT